MIAQVKIMLAIAVIFIVMVCLPALATIIEVPEDYSTIQAGIDASSDGDTVLVQPDTYVENINFNGHDIVLGSLFLTTGDTSFISQTIIDGDSAGTVVMFNNNENNAAVISGFTICNGNNCCGGGIWCESTSPIISNNTITRNSAPGIFGFGGGIYCDFYSSPIISNNAISGNYASHYGGGIYCGQSCSPKILNNIISGNSSNRNGGGIQFYCSGYSTVSNNTITGNSANRFGGGIYSYSITTHSKIVNTILWANNADSIGNEIYLSGTPSITITYSNIQDGWHGEGNINADPLFRDPENGDFHLMSTHCGDLYDSPCIDMGHPLILDSLLDCSRGLGYPRSDMGAYGGYKMLIYEYIPGDANMYIGLWPPAFYGADVIYLVKYISGYTSSQPCLLDGFWASADANGDCQIVYSDVTRMVSYFGGNGIIEHCSDYPTAWHTPDDIPTESPDNWPNCE